MSAAPTLLLVRHGLTESTGETLTGWTPGVSLDTRGRSQAAGVAQRLSTLELAAVVSSPLQRCQETAQIIAEGNLGRPVPHIDERFGECDYGEWTGRALEDLAGEPLWRVVQAHPSAAEFPGGESLAGMAHRAVSAVRDWNHRLAAQFAESAAQTPANPVYLACSHGDVIKSIVADALGLHLDQFQRIRVDPGSLTAIRYTEFRPFVVRLNDVGGGVVDFAAEAGEATGDAPVGGGAGSGEQA